MPIAASLGAPRESARSVEPVAALRFRRSFAPIARRITRPLLTGCRRKGTSSSLEGALPGQRRAAGSLPGKHSLRPARACGGKAPFSPKPMRLFGGCRMARRPATLREGRNCAGENDCAEEILIDPKNGKAEAAPCSRKTAGSSASIPSSFGEERRRTGRRIASRCNSHEFAIVGDEATPFAADEGHFDDFELILNNRPNSEFLATVSVASSFGSPHSPSASPTTAWVTAARGYCSINGTPLLRTSDIVR